MLSNTVTRKLYYEEPYAFSCPCVITRVGNDFVELDVTVAYPEGGGQESDVGRIVFADGAFVRFIDVKKVLTTPINLGEVDKEVHVGGIIRHLIHADDLLHLSELSSGISAVVEIDIVRRAKLSLSHTASHLLYMAVANVRENAVHNIFGCHIKEGAARFDFCVPERFSSEDLESISEKINVLSVKDLDVSISQHSKFQDVRYWECNGQVIPCGGTHIENTKNIGVLMVKRKGLGSGKERLSCEFPLAEYVTSKFYRSGEAK